MNKKDARELIEFAIDNNVIMSPDRARFLYEHAEYPMPQYLIPEELTDEERERRSKLAEWLFYPADVPPNHSNNVTQRFVKSPLEDAIRVQINGGTDEEIKRELRGYARVYWDKEGE